MGCSRESGVSVSRLLRHDRVMRLARKQAREVLQRLVISAFRPLRSEQEVGGICLLVRFREDCHQIVVGNYPGHPGHTLRDRGIDLQELAPKAGGRSTRAYSIPGRITSCE